MKLVVPRDVYLPVVGDEVKEGDVIDVDDDAGRSLVEQGWKKAPKSAKPDAVEPDIEEKG